MKLLIMLIGLLSACPSFSIETREIEALLLKENPADSLYSDDVFEQLTQWNPEVAIKLKTYKSSELNLRIRNFLSSKYSEKPLIAFFLEILEIQNQIKFLDQISTEYPDWVRYKKRVVDDKLQRRQRIGFMTGVFNPVHFGHLEVFENALKEAELDVLYVIPTPATTHNEKPIEWSLRKEMVKLAVTDHPKIRVIDDRFKSALDINTGVAIHKLIDELGNNRFIHIMGLDSFVRYAQAGHYDKNSANEVFVAARGGAPFPLDLGSPSRGDNILFFNLQTIENHSEDNRSSSKIRQLLEQSKSISTLVSEPVKNFIVKNKLYKNNLNQYCFSFYVKHP